jgi:D-serine deaminase-like pyridoxal phosphate-dependent protein
MRQTSTGSGPAKVEDLPSPALIVDLDAFERNVAAAADLVRGSGTNLRPHVKTHRTPGLAIRQLGPHAHGVTCATVGEAEAMVAAGIDDVFLANEIVSPGKADRLARLGRDAQVAVAVDSQHGVDVIAAAAARARVDVAVLVDVDVGLARCGVPGPDEAVALGRVVAGTPRLRLRGIMGYEGRLRAANAERGQRIDQAETGLAEVRQAFAAAGLACEVVSSGGTSTFRQAVADPDITEIQAGTYALMETDLAGLGLPFVPALTVSAMVISRSDGRVVLDAGRKSISCDYGPPTPLPPEATLTAINEEHTTLRWDGELPGFGVRVELRPLHVRLTFNLHDEVWLARGDKVIDRLPVVARGRSA